MGSALISHFLRGLRRSGNAMSFGGRLRLSQSILRRVFRFVDREVTISDFNGKFVIRLILSEHMQRRIFWMGYYSTDIVALLKRVLRPGMVVADVGANIGEITLVSAKCVGSEGKVIAFEPVNAIADRLAEHVQVNGLNQVLIRREALGTKIGDRVPIYASCGQDVSDDHQGLASLYGENEGQAPIQYVNVTTLDEVTSSLSLAPIDLIKIDVEGGELACLQGAERVLRRSRPMLIVEVQKFSARQAGWDVDELFRYLQRFGYEFFTIGSRGRLRALDLSSLVDFQNVFCKVRDRVE
ncbi:MAG TPA: FkbM family methyltransferase [Pseudomonas sabulinigri]|uniref:Methyltransferase FkbM domain-containing protein n=1 Tax=marine sediment metagenome TaxID=412755 RepID=A0A0F9V7K9_9ZZZZ|nr:FkbM family methyltransferase [Halopseudomonas sabulinigri]HEC52383.1 FkbM family methyltransferase [Halopseudomonas sabulinigri]